MGKNAAILQQIEEAERNEVHNERLTREVHEFFSDATRTAADIVQRITGTHEEASASKLHCEIQDFLNDVIARAESFMTALGQTRGGGLEQELEAKMHNLVGRQLDEFRNEGTAQLDDKHIGQDPFQTPAEPTPSVEATPMAEERGHEAPPPSQTSGVEHVEESTDDRWNPEAVRPTGPMWDTAADEADPVAEAQPTQSAPPGPEPTPPLAMDADKMSKAIDVLVAGGILDREAAESLCRALDKS